jgi:uncharacterized membrane protein (UPF0127 family)
LQSAVELGESEFSASTCISIAKFISSVRQAVNSPMPKTITIENKNRRIEGALRIRYCDTFFTQLRGFTLRSSLSRDEGLLLVGTRDSRLDSSIHMFFVSFDLSVIWINSAMQVVDKVLARSWRPAYFSRQPARYVLEIHPDRWGEFEIGDRVEFKDA